MYFVKYFPNCCDFLISRHGFSKFPIFISTSHNLRNISFCRNFLKVKPRNLSNSLKYFSGLNLKSNDKSNHISSGKCDFTSCYSTTAHNSDKLTHTPNSLAPESDKIEVSDSSKPPFIVFDSMALTFDLDHAIAYTNRVLDDPISDISVSETSKFLIPFPNSDMPRVLEVLTKPFRYFFKILIYFLLFRESYTYEPATTMIQLCVERLENDRLTETFDIGDGFNKRAYFLTLHLWLLYRRALKEAPEGILLKNYLLEICYNVFRDWLFVRKVPEYMFNREFQNTQNHMLKFLLELNKSSEDEDLYPFRLSETIRR
eukprot:XP_765018.1 hypothetical protein [Theileria parva strain Muguga]